MAKIYAIQFNWFSELDFRFPHIFEFEIGAVGLIIIIIHRPHNTAIQHCYIICSS